MEWGYQDVEYRPLQNIVGGFINDKDKVRGGIDKVLELVMMYLSDLRGEGVIQSL